MCYSLLELFAQGIEKMSRRMRCYSIYGIFGLLIGGAIGVMVSITPGGIVMLAIAGAAFAGELSQIKIDQGG